MLAERSRKRAGQRWALLSVVSAVGGFALAVAPLFVDVSRALTGASAAVIPVLVALAGSTLGAVVARFVSHRLALHHTGTQRRLMPNLDRMHASLETQRREVYERDARPLAPISQPSPEPRQIHG